MKEGLQLVIGDQLKMDCWSLVCHHTTFQSSQLRDLTSAGFEDYKSDCPGLSMYLTHILYSEKKIPFEHKCFSVMNVKVPKSKDLFALEWENGRIQQMGGNNSITELCYHKASLRLHLYLARF